VEGTETEDAAPAETEPPEQGAPDPRAGKGSESWLKRHSTCLLAIGLLGAVLVVVVFFVGKELGMWAGKSLDPLQEDPLAAEDLLGLELLSSGEDDGTALDNWFSIEGGHGSARIGRTFALPETGWEDVVIDIATYAEDNGWERQLDGNGEVTDWDEVFTYTSAGKVHLYSTVTILYEKPHPRGSMMLYIYCSPEAPEEGVELMLRWVD
jgi:hypothetical protein